MKNFFKNSFGGLEPSYLIRQYLFGLAFFSFMVSISLKSMPPTFIVFLVANLLLYPFAMFVYDSIMGMILGNSGIITNIIISIIWVFFKVAIIFSFTIIIAPFGMLYLHFRALKNN